MSKRTEDLIYWVVVVLAGLGVAWMLWWALGW
jgi:hypothetical protein